MKNKKTVLILCIIVIVITVVITITKFKKYDFSIDITTNKEKVTIGEEVILKIKTEKNVVASNFEINYNSQNCELINTTSNNLYISEKNGKIACIYFDIDQKGTDIFEIKFKVKDNKNNNAEFTIENTKFRVFEQDESYIDEQIKGLNKVLKVNIR